MQKNVHLCYCKFQVCKFLFRFNCYEWILPKWFHEDVKLDILIRWFETVTEVTTMASIVCLQAYIFACRKQLEWNSDNF